LQEVFVARLSTPMAADSSKGREWQAHDMARCAFDSQANSHDRT